jgi:hypothetical protein
VVVLIQCVHTLPVTQSLVVVAQAVVVDADVVREVAMDVVVDEVEDVERGRKPHTHHNHRPVRRLIMSEEVAVLKGKCVFCTAYPPPLNIC